MSKTIHKASWMIENIIIFRRIYLAGGRNGFPAIPNATTIHTVVYAAFGGHFYLEQPSAPESLGTEVVQWEWNP